MTTYQRIITTIDARWRGGAPFATWELRDACNVSASTARRMIYMLHELRLVVKGKKGYAARQWRVAPRWRDVTVRDVIENVEMAKIMGLKTSG